MSLCLNCCVSSLIAHELVCEQIFLFGLGLFIKRAKTEAQTWFIYKQTNMDKLFIELSPSCLWTTWFIYMQLHVFSYLSCLCVLFLSLSLNPLPWQQQSKNHLCQSPSIIDETHQAPTLTTKSTRPNHKLNPPITACPITNQTHRPQTQSLEKSTNHIKQNQ